MALMTFQRSDSCFHLCRNQISEATGSLWLPIDTLPDSSANRIQIMLTGHHMNITFFGIKAAVLSLKHSCNRSRRFAAHTPCKPSFFSL